MSETMNVVMLATLLTKHYCLSPESAMTLLSLTNDIETDKSVCKSMFAGFAKASVRIFSTVQRFFIFI